MGFTLFQFQSFYFHSEREKCLIFKLSVNPLLDPGGAYLFQAHLRRGGGAYLRGGFICLEMTMVSVLHKELEYKVEKPKYKKAGSHAAEDRNQIRTSIGK